MMRSHLTSVKPLCRFAGSKWRTGPRFLRYFDLGSIKVYVEPFVGAGGMTSHVVPRLPEGTTVVLNDLDPGVAALWQAVAAESALHALCERVGGFTPSIRTFEMYWRNPVVEDSIETAFRCLVLHQCSFNGLGPKAGGPMGGWHQDRRIDIRSRWHTEQLQDNLRRWYELFRTMSVQVVNCDAVALLDQIPDSEHVLVYADPPYVKVGPDLYTLAFDEHGHRRLATRLRSTKRLRWAVTYDDHPLVREIYEGVWIEEVDVRAGRSRRGASGTPEAALGVVALRGPYAHAAGDRVAVAPTAVSTTNIRALVKENRSAVPSLLHQSLPSLASIAIPLASGRDLTPAGNVLTELCGDCTYCPVASPQCPARRARARVAEGKGHWFGPRSKTSRGTGHPILYSFDEALHFGPFPEGGGYPKRFLRLAYASLGVTDPAKVLHLCSGSMLTGIRVDIRWCCHPTVVADVRNLPFKDESFQWILADPPYSDTYAANLYGTDAVYPTPGKILREAARVLRVGGRVGLLHVTVPVFRKPLKLLKVYIGTLGCGYAVRALTVLEKVAP
jgi:DNA adenine methylase